MNQSTIATEEFNNATQVRDAVAKVSAERQRTAQIAGVAYPASDKATAEDRAQAAQALPGLEAEEKNLRSLLRLMEWQEQARH